MSKSFKHMTVDEKLNVLYNQNKLIMKMHGVKKPKPSDISDEEMDNHFLRTTKPRRSA